MSMSKDSQPASFQIPEDIHFSESPDPLKFIGYYLEHSEFLHAISRANNGIFKPENLRKLAPAEIKTLLEQKNYASDWDNILVTRDFTAANIINNQFLGKTTIGRLDGTIHSDDLEHTCSIINSTLYNVQIGNNTLIKNVHSLSNVAIFDGAAVSNCHVVSHGNDHHFGVGREMALAIESGGRELRIFPEINIDVARILCRRRGDKQLLEQYSLLIEKYIKAAGSTWSVLAEGSLIANTSKVINIFLGRGAIIDNACVVENAVVLSDPSEPVVISDGAVVKNSMVQWGTEITTGAVAERAVFTEHSGAERHAKVLDSLIGANTTIAEGEVSSSLVGSFVGFHHQSLLIAAYWPEGKGNISYGANVGSNHTGKKNDQEIWPGEGVFFGLACAIKMPANFTEAPYSIIATACTTLPQKVSFPFSLINQPSASFPDISPAINEIMPAWVLSDNIYMIMRNEGKYRKRNKAKRIYIKFDIFRPSIVKKMVWARDELKKKSGKEVYTDRDIAGLGKNYLTEAQRLKAIDAYSFYIKYFCLDTLFRAMMDGDRQLSALSDAMADEHEDQYWAYARSIFHAEVGKTDTKELAQILIGMKREIADSVLKSKQKDDVRGRIVIDDYPEAHGRAEDDEFVIDVRQRMDKDIALLRCRFKV